MKLSRRDSLYRGAGKIKSLSRAEQPPGYRAYRDQSGGWLAESIVGYFEDAQFGLDSALSVRLVYQASQQLAENEKGAEIRVRK